MNAVIIGAGHNGLVAAAVLARAGRTVTLLDAAPVLGGACRTERPFTEAPNLACSTGAYLLGPMPPEVIDATGIASSISILPRRPHGVYFNEHDAPVAFGIPGGDVNLSPHDRAATESLDRMLHAIRDALAPFWLRPNVRAADTINAVPAHARDLYQLILGSPPLDSPPVSGGRVSDILESFTFHSELLKAVIATDGFVGSTGGYHTPGTALNFLAHNMLRLPPGDAPKNSSPLGAWQLVKGGMGAITSALATSATNHGATIRLRTLAKIVHTSRRGSHSRVESVELDTGEKIAADAVLLATDPFRARVLCDEPEMSPIWSRLNALSTPGTSLKVNLALRSLPKVPRARALAPLADRHPLAGTLHILPQSDTLNRLEHARLAALDGRLPDPSDMMIDVYTHTAVDNSLCDDRGRHAMSLFVQWVPPDIALPDAEALAWSLIRGPIARFIPDLPNLIDDVMVLTPRGIEQRFGISSGHIHHLDNAFAFEHRLPSATPIEGVFLCGAGCHPAGSVIGCAGLIAARLALAQ